MPSARPKVKASKSRDGDHHLPMFSDLECSQGSPHLCAICDGSCDLVICDGPCIHQFHIAHTEREKIGICPWVFIPPEKKDEPWYCPECVAEIASCFQCKRTGRMHSIVRNCTEYCCTRWYCEDCLPHHVPNICPLHKCDVCEMLLSLEDGVQCLRCPVGLHLDCLALIQGKDVEGTRWGDDRPIWEHEAHDQVRHMVYCPNHPLDPMTGIPGLADISSL